MRKRQTGRKRGRGGISLLFALLGLASGAWLAYALVAWRRALMPELQLLQQPANEQTAAEKAALEQPAPEQPSPGPVAGERAAPADKAAERRAGAPPAAREATPEEQSTEEPISLYAVSGEDSSREWPAAPIDSETSGE